MKALTVVDENYNIKVVEKDQPVAGQGEVLVAVKAAALNHRDQWIRQGMYPNIQVGSTLGSDGSGVVESVGEGVSGDWIGKEVIINPNIDWGDNPDVQSFSYNILGMPKDGTMAEYVVVGVDRLHMKPKHLTLTEASAIPLAGLTAYRALMKHGTANSDKNVLVTGIGGGVALWALQFALAIGAKTWVTSSSRDKIERAVKHGATEGFDSSQEKWYKEASKSGGFDVVIDSTGGDKFNDYIRVLRPGGKIVFYGASLGAPSKLDVFRLFWMQGTLQGSTMGNDQEFGEMVELIEKESIKPVIDSIRPFDEIISAFDDMRDRKQMGKLVVEF